MISVEVLKEATDEAVAQLGALSAALHGDQRPFSRKILQEIVENDSIALVVARDNSKIIGMGTLYMVPKIGKRSSYLEDVIVDGAYRGKGLGEQIVRFLIDTARARGANQINLTSRPERAAAHALYKKLGFKQRETNVFKLVL